MPGIDRGGVEKKYRERLFSNIQDVSDNDIQYIYLKDLLRRFTSKDIYILDAGCGNGKYARKLASTGYNHIYAVDLFDTLPLSTGFSYSKASIDNTRYGEGSFDLIYSLSVIYYMNSPEEAMREFYRLLKPGGIVLITAHTKYSLHTLSRYIKRALGFKSMDHLKDVKFYSASEYVEMFLSEGFHILKIDGYQLFGYFSLWYRRLAARIERTTGVKFPKYTPKVGACRLYSHIKSVFGYHSVIIAIK